jgi:hypothetical protein
VPRQFCGRIFCKGDQCTQSVVGGPKSPKDFDSIESWRLELSTFCVTRKISASRDVPQKRPRPAQDIICSDPEDQSACGSCRPIHFRVCSFANRWIRQLPACSG